MWPRVRHRFEVARKRRLPDCVEDQIDALAAGDFLDLVGEVRLGVDDHVARAHRFGLRGLFSGRRRADHVRAEVRRVLREQQADAAGDRVHEHRRARSDRAEVVQAR